MVNQYYAVATVAQLQRKPGLINALEKIGPCAGRLLCQNVVAAECFPAGLARLLVEKPWLSPVLMHGAATE